VVRPNCPLYLCRTSVAAAGDGSGDRWGDRFGESDQKWQRMTFFGQRTNGEIISVA
jgi:hypothetical protein